MTGTILSIAALLPTAFSCIADKDYVICGAKDVNTEMTLFANGLEIPVGSTAELYLDSIVNTAGDSTVRSLLSSDADGNYSLGYSGTYSLDKVIEDLDIIRLRNIDGIGVKEDFKVEIHGIDPQNVTVHGINTSADIRIEEIGLPNISIPVLDTSGKVSFDIAACLPEDGKLEGVLGKLTGYSSSVLSPSTQVDFTQPGGQLTRTTFAQAVEALSGGDADKRIPVQDILADNNLANVEFTPCTEHVSIGTDLNIDEGDIASVANVRLKNGGKLKVDVEVDNPMFTSGTVTPAVKVDLSGILVMQGPSVIDLSDMVIDLSEGSSMSKDFPVTGFAEGQPSISGKHLSADSDVNLEGTVRIDGASTTHARVQSAGDRPMTLKIKVSMDGLALESMDVTLGSNVSYRTDGIEIPIGFSKSLPSEIASVENVLFNPEKAISVRISCPSLKGLATSDGKKHLDIPLSAVIKFPDGVTVKDPDTGTANTVTLKGNLFDGDITRDIVILSIKPVCSGGRLSYDGIFRVDVSTEASGSFSTAGTGHNSIIRTDVFGEPEMSDYSITLDMDALKDKLIANQEKDFSFDITGADDFGTFNVIPQSTADITLGMNLPDLDEASPINGHLKIKLPDAVVIDKDRISGMPYRVEAGNAVVIDGAVPESITVPVKSLHITPERDSDGKLTVKDKISLTGSIAPSTSHITKKTIDALSGKTITLEAAMPALDIREISLDGAFSKKVTDSLEVTFLDESVINDLPEEIRNIKEVLLDSTELRFEIKHDGLPITDGTQFVLKDAYVDLPEFISLTNGGSRLEIPDIQIANNKPVVLKAGIAGLKDIDFSQRRPINGKVKFSAWLYSDKPGIDIEKVSSEVRIALNAALGNGTTASDPGKIVIDRIIANASYPLSQTFTIPFEDLPDGLGDIEFHVNPTLTLDISTNLAIPVDASMTLSPYFAGECNKENEITISGVSLPYSENAAVTASKRYAIGRNAVAPEGGTAILTDLGVITRRIPDSIRIRLTADVDPATECIIETSARYNCNLDYALNVPLLFENEPEIRFPLADIELDEDVARHMKDICFGIKGGIVSTMPVGATATVILLDADDKEIPTSEKISFSILPSLDGKTPVTSDISQVIKFNDTSSATPAKLRLEITAAPVQGIQLNGNEYIQVQNISVVLPEGITILPEGIAINK